MAIKNPKSKRNLYSYKRVESITRILRVIADYYQVPMLVYKTASRYPESVKVKQIARYLSVQFLNKKGVYYKSILNNNDDIKFCSMAEIGKATGGRDHFVTYQALEYVQNHIDTEPDYKAEVDEIIAMIFKSVDFGGRRIISVFEEDGLKVTITSDKLKNVFCEIDTGSAVVTIPYDKMDVLYSIWQAQRRKKVNKF